MTMALGFRLWASGAGLTVALLVATTAQAQTAPSEVNLRATSVNVAEPGSPIKMRISRWSTDEERTPVLAALNPPPPVSAPAAAAPAAGSPAGAGGGRAAAVGGRAAGRGGRGGRRGGGDAAAPPSPIAVLTAALGRAPTLGYIWTNDVTGYSIKYAYRTALPDGGERIILATDRRLGAHIPAWKPVGTGPLTDYEFSLIEILLNAKGAGEGKVSLTTKVIVDNEAKTVALDNYAMSPVILQRVTRQ
jgi:hypothetical protein